MRIIIYLSVVFSFAAHWSCTPSNDGSVKKGAPIVPNTTPSLDQISKSSALNGTWEYICTENSKDRISEKVTLQISNGTMIAKTSFYGYTSNCQGAVVWEQIATSKLALEGSSVAVEGATNLVSTLQGVEIKPLHPLAVETLQGSFPSKNWILNVATQKPLDEGAKVPAFSIVKIVDGKICFGKELGFLPSSEDLRPKSLQPISECGSKI